MQNQLKTDPLKSATFSVLTTGIFTFLSFLVLFFSDNPAPAFSSVYGKAITCLQMATDHAMIDQCIGVNPLGEEIIHKIKIINYKDFFFMISYSLFSASLFFLLTVLNRLRMRRYFGTDAFFRIGLILSLAMLAGDLAETILEFTILERKESYAELIVFIIAVRLKFASIFLASILTGLSFSSFFGKSPLVLIAFLFNISGFLGIMSLIAEDGKSFLELTVAGVGLAWFIAFLYAIFLFLKTPKDLTQ